MYVSPNFKTKKALKEAIEQGKTVIPFQSGLGDVPENGTICVEGPHYPKPHTWYAECEITNGLITKVKK